MSKRYTVLASESGDEAGLQPLCNVDTNPELVAKAAKYRWASRSAGIRKYRLVQVVDNQTGEVVIRAPKIQKRER